MAAATQPYDQRDGYIWMNGELISWRDARVHLLTHALHYGSAVFEGERVYDGEIFKLTEHSQRLHESAKGLDFEIPYSVAEIDKACRDVVRANKLVDGYVRPLAWRGSEQMGVAAQATKINLAIAAWDWGSYFDPAARTKGLRLTIGTLSQARPAHGAGQEQGGWPLYDLHHRETSRREGGLCRCADARLARADRRGDRRQYLLRQGRRAAHAAPRLLPRRHHAPHRHRARQAAWAEGGRARRSCQRRWRISPNASSPAPPPR